MRTLVHLSDLHFGRVDHAIIEPLIATVQDLKPDVVAVSGDLTQRARSRQFQEARAFLDALPAPQIVVPGNHDVPLYNLFARFFQPLQKYRRYITDDLEPFYCDEEIAVLGINTARALTIKHGRINARQIASIGTRLGACREKITRVLVTHHPFDVPAGQDEDELVIRAPQAMEALVRFGIDVLLAGHLHVSYTGHTVERYRIATRSALVVSAGTATSTRYRGECNSFNVLRIRHPHIEVAQLVWQSERAAFASTRTEHFTYTSRGWARALHERAAL